MTYALTHEEISPSPSSGWDLGLWADIYAFGLGLRPQGWDLYAEAVEGKGEEGKRFPHV